MNPATLDFWNRALRALKTARACVGEDPDAAASRAYYAAFYAVSACFLAQGRAFSKHTAVQAALHRELVKTGKVSGEVGTAYSALLDLRNVGDYGGHSHVTPSEARQAVAKAQLILDAIRQITPQPLPKRIQKKRSRK